MKAVWEAVVYPPHEGQETFVIFSLNRSSSLDRIAADRPDGI